MLNLLRAITPRALFFLGLYAFIVKVVFVCFWIFIPGQFLDPTDSNFFAVFQPSRISQFPLALIIIFIQAALLYQIFKSIPFFEERTYVVPAIFIALTSISLNTSLLSLPLLLNFINIAIIGQLVRLSFDDNAIKESFKIGFLLGLWIVFEPSTIFVFPFVVIAFYLLKPFRINELALIVIGAFGPTYFIFALNYVFEIALPPPFAVNLIGFFHPVVDLLVLTPIVIIILFGLFSVFHYRVNFAALSTLQKRLSSALTIVFLGMFVLIAFIGKANWSILCYLIPILAIFIAMYLLRITNKMRAEIIHAIFVLVILFSQIINLF